jgi:predicted dehydrogenase
MEGASLLASAMTLPSVECVGAADLYDGRHTLAKELTHNPDLPVPDFWHKQVVIDACQAGKDVYCEKPMSHTVAEGFDMVQAAGDDRRIVQVGSQRVSSALCVKARDMYRAGAIGEITMIELTLGRNSPSGAWVYPPPARSVSFQSGLGYLAEGHAENPIQP